MATASRPRRYKGRGADAVVVAADPDAVRPALREETFPVALAAVVLSFVALVVCYGHGWLLLYGDAVAHLGIARRILDSRNPGLGQLGGVWLPLPHLLMLPFVQKMQWWQNGLAGAWPSMACYVFGVVGLYRLARRMMAVRWAFAAAVFYALNPNLLYLATTAMTEPLFLALLIWTVLTLVEFVAAVRDGRLGAASRRLVGLGLLIFCAVMTRYDGWILGAAVWCWVALVLVRAPAVLRRVRVWAVVFTVVVVAGPVGWLAYNAHYYGDALDFMRGPYSASAIEKKTSAAGVFHPGWHDPVVALRFYRKSAQMDTAYGESGLALMWFAVAGAVVVVRRRGLRASLLLWMPMGFYAYSVTWGSVPVFIPVLWPFSFYNVRYGMEMLPAFAIFCAMALSWLQARLRAEKEKHVVLMGELVYPVALAVCAANAVGMMYEKPLVLREAIANSRTRVPFEEAVARELGAMRAGVPILMETGNYVGALQRAGIPLARTINEAGYYGWREAVADPAGHAAFVVAFEGDSVDAAVKAHPAGLTELTVLRTTGQPAARIYRSDVYRGDGGVTSAK